MLVSIFDTTISDNNLGNAVIMDAVNGVMDEIFPNAFLLRHPCLDSIGKVCEDYLRESQFAFFGGTNMLCSNMESYNQWDIISSRKVVSGVVLCGVGWVQYQDKPSSFTKNLLVDVLHHSYYHSVRDSYAEFMLRSIGFQNVLNTSCPTMWCLTREHCAGIAKEKAESVLVTLTNYNQNVALDKALLSLLQKNYKSIHLWVQGPEDMAYARQICQNLDILPPRLSALDDFLRSDRDIEYVGTRLHAGIRALQYGRRATILGIDNRAIEINRDTGLPVVARDDLTGLQDRLNGLHSTKIHLPLKAIESWKRQFI